MGTCLPFRLFLECLQGPSFAVAPSYAHLEEQARVKLDITNIGSDVVIIKNGERICGCGAALANAPLVQNKSYFEIKLQQAGLSDIHLVLPNLFKCSDGIWGVGVALREIDLNVIPLGDTPTSWVLRHDGALVHDSQRILTLPEPIEEGDVIGVSYDHVDLIFYKNGKPLNASFSTVKGQIYPVVYVGDGAILDVKFTSFWFSPPQGHVEIMFEQTIL